VKAKVLRGNHQPHVTPTLRKAIMKRSRLKNIANRSGNAGDIQAYKKQRNYVVSLNKREKKRFFQKAGNPNSQSSKSFWEACRPIFSAKFSGPEDSVSLIEKGSLISDEMTVSNIFNNHYVNISRLLPLAPNLTTASGTDLTDILSAFKDHPSIHEINCKNFEGIFELKHVYPWEVKKAIQSLKSNKATSGPIPTDILQKCLDECVNSLTDCIHTSFLDGHFPSELCRAEVVPVHKGQDCMDKENYRPISILPVISKVFEKILFSRVSEFLESRLSKLLCGFRSKHNSQHALFRLLCKWQEWLLEQS